MEVILSIYENKFNLENAVKSLNNAGYFPEILSINMKDKEYVRKFQNLPQINLLGGMFSGLVIGAAIGSILALVIGTQLTAINPLISHNFFNLTGTSAITVTGALMGGILGAAVGSLIGLNLPEPTEFVENEVYKVAYLLSVPAREGGEVEDVKNIVRSFGGKQIREVTTDHEKNTKDFMAYNIKKNNRREWLKTKLIQRQILGTK